MLKQRTTLLERPAGSDSVGADWRPAIGRVWFNLERTRPFFANNGDGHNLLNRERQAKSIAARVSTDVEPSKIV